MSVHPWIVSDAEHLQDHLTQPAENLSLSGPRNDWLTGALGIKASQSSTVKVTVNALEALKDRIQLRVVGFVLDASKHAQLDALLGTEDFVTPFPTPAKSVLMNYDAIKDFPTLTVTPDQPVMLWLTVDLRNVPSGQYQASVVFEGSDGQKQTVPLKIHVLKAELPIVNPLHVWMWESVTSYKKPIEMYLEHGVNVFRTHQESAWSSGARFLVFNLSASWHRAPITDAKRAEVHEKLDKIWETVERLGVPLDQWAVQVADETADASADIDVAYAKIVKEYRPNTPILFNPPWVQKPGGGNSTTMDGTLRKIAPYADVWCPYNNHLWDGSGAFAFMKETGKPVWFYEIWGGASRRPEVGQQMLRQGPWIAWKYGLSGFGNYSSDAYAGDSWLHNDGGEDDHSFTYVIPGAGLISTRGFEVVRQGVQEYKRLYTLAKLGADKQTLNTMVDQVVKGADVKVIDDYRSQLDDMLVKLSAHSSTKNTRR